MRLTRARKRLDNYLAPLCQFVDKANPCNCEGRLGVALAKEFISFPRTPNDIPHAPHDSGPEFHDMGALYRALPAIALTEEQREKLLATCPEASPPEDLEEHLMNLDDLDDLNDMDNMENLRLAGPIEPDHPAGPNEPAQPDDPIVPGPEPIHVPSDPAVG